jgi:hypothetical protein
MCQITSLDVGNVIRSAVKARNKFYSCFLPFYDFLDVFFLQEKSANSAFGSSISRFCLILSITLSILAVDIQAETKKDPAMCRMHIAGLQI